MTSTFCSAITLDGVPDRKAKLIGTEKKEQGQLHTRVFFWSGWKVQ
jgi:hypothetical protein